MHTLSPKITHVQWGLMQIEGVGDGKDFKLFPGGGREWDWRETGTHHTPGILPTDVKELLANGAEVIVLSRGMLLALKTAPETKQFLEQKGIPFYIEETKRAVRRYNELRKRIPVGGLFHSTC